MNKIVLIASLIVFAGCRTAKTSGTPQQPVVEPFKSKFPGFTEANFNEGRSLFEQHCGTCHGLPHPASQTEARWVEIVSNMSGMVNNNKPNTLDDAKQDLIFKYLVTAGGG